MSNIRYIIAAGGVISLLIIFLILWNAGVEFPFFIHHIVIIGCAVFGMMHFHSFYIYSVSRYRIYWIRESYTIPFVSYLSYAYLLYFLTLVVLYEIQEATGMDDYLIYDPIIFTISTTLFLSIFSWMNKNFSNLESESQKSME